MVASSISLLTFIILSLRNEKKLRAHPAKLINVICTLEAALCYSAYVQSPLVGAGYFSCYFHSYQLFQLSLFRTDRSDESLKTIVFFNEFLFMFLQTGSLVANFCLCHDLLSTLKSPFDKAEARLRIYWLIIFVVPITLDLALLVGVVWLGG